MEYERKFILTTEELRELLMRCWVSGWNSKEDMSDNRKREDSAYLIAELIKEAEN